jgi:BirA family biotin operon repressor/biotin-[acetyl-CoA-carboxylase] ligase
VNPVIKWPNDVIIDGRKICGILCEGVIRDGVLKGIICGIGVNLNLTQEALDTIDQPAISLSVVTGEKINLKKFTDELAIYLNWYYITGNNHALELYRVWKERNAVIGTVVTLCPPSGEPFSAKVLDISRDGRLIVEKENGEQIHFSCGDVKLKPSSNLI